MATPGRGAALLMALRKKKMEEAAKAKKEQPTQVEASVVEPDITPAVSPPKEVEPKKQEDAGDATKLAETLSETKLEEPEAPEATKETLTSEKPPTVKLSAPSCARTIFQPQEAVSYRGSAGKPIPLSANYLSLEFGSDHGVFEHQVEFHPAVDAKRERFRMLWLHKDVIPPNKIFDGSKLLLPFQLGKEGESTTLTATVEETGVEQEVVVTFIAKKSTQDPELIQVVNCLFSRVFRQLNMPRMSTMGAMQSYFNPALKDSLPKHKLEIWPGYNLVVDFFEGGLHVQCDLVSKVMRTQTVLDVISELFKGNKASVPEAAKKALLGLTVITRYNNKTYKIDEIDFDTSPEDSFPNKRTGGQTTYLDYYRDHYALEIKDKRQPMIITHLKVPNAKPDDAPIKILLVPELCFLIGMTESQRQNFNVMKDVAAFTRHTPTARQDTMLKFFQSIRANPECHETFKAWGMNIAEKNVRFAGRLVAPPTLYFGGGQKEAVGPKADWGRATTNKRGLKMVDMKKWTIIAPTREKVAVKTFCDIIAQVAPKMGMAVAKPAQVDLQNDRVEGYLKAIRELPKDTQIVVTIFPGGVQKADRYAAVKKLCYLDKALPSQVVMQKTLANEKRQQAVLQKIALQMNCKLGGELWGLSIPIKHLCVVGIDVYRDKCGSGRNIAAIVTSMNGSFSRYHSQLVFEKQNSPFHLDMAAAVRIGMEKYGGENGGVFPDRLIVYRDGCPGGHYSALVKEADAIKEALVELGGTVPALSYLIVQKRINTRLFDVSRPKADNPPAGTVLDHTITLHGFKDFYLVPMSVTQGTVTPTHYIIMSEPDDDRAMKPDVVQKVTFALTHMYFNWPGNVKVPAPCQYAHKLVEMVGEHLHKQAHEDLEHTLFYL